LIPTETRYIGQSDGVANYGMLTFDQLFTPRQLLGHLTLIAGLIRLKPEILTKLGADRGRAVIT
jgi:putative DNA methylase